LLSRARFLPWYRVVASTLGELVADLSDVEAMEYVSEDRLLTVPLARREPEGRPLPVIEVEVRDEQLSVNIAYRDAECLRHLRNILHPSQVEAQEAFTAAMRLLPVVFETRLTKRAFKESNFTLVKKYLANRVDSALLSLLVEEAEAMRSGGRQNLDGRSVYLAPAKPVLQLVYAQIEPTEDALRAILNEMKSVLYVVSAVKTQREIIHSRLAKPLDQANKYRDFIELLNKARGQVLISAEERRSLEKKWREIPEERGPIEEDLKRRLGEPT